MMLFDSALNTRTIQARSFRSEEDFWRVRSLLIETYPITPTDFNWDIRRWDGWRFHREETDITPEWSERVHLWETDTGRLVGVAHPEGRGDAFFELHPDYRHIEEEMLAWAENNLTLEMNGSRQLDIAVQEYDVPRRRLLEQRDYDMLPYTFVTRRLRFGGKPLSEPKLAAGYILRGTFMDAVDYQRAAEILNAAFNRTIHTAKEFARFATRSPSYNPDLNLVAATRDGTFAAMVGVTYDTVNHRGIFEPVCTHPDHRRRGLARALMLEGMRRLKVLGATDVYVGTGDAAAANALYDEIGFTEAYKGSIWRKVF